MLKTCWGIFHANIIGNAGGWGECAMLQYDYVRRQTPDEVVQARGADQRKAATRRARPPTTPKVLPVVAALFDVVAAAPAEEVEDGPEGEVVVGATGVTCQQ